MTTSKKARNGAGAVERHGLLWWVRVSMPKAPGERKPAVPASRSPAPRA
jgi:hypothetical protein